MNIHVYVSKLITEKGESIIAHLWEKLYNICRKQDEIGCIIFI
jgi:hypothetical protein